MDSSRKAPMVILFGNSHPELNKLICDRLDIPAAKCSVLHNTSRETQVEIKQTVRARDVYIIQTGTKNVNDDIMELLILGYACKTSCARNIVGVVPYLPYCKQSKMRKRGSVVSRLLADMIIKAGFTQMITMDLRHKEIQGFYSFPVDNLRASSYLIQYIRDSIPDYRNSVIVAKNPNSMKRASSYSERLQLPLAVVHGEEKLAEQDTDDGRTSPPLVESQTEGSHSTKDSRITSINVHNLPALTPKEKPPLHVVGDVGGKIAIVVDDLIDEVNSFVAVADLLHEGGAYKVFVIATHGLLSLDAPQLIQDSHIDEVVVTNTIPHAVQKLQCNKIRTVDVSGLFAEAIRRIHNRESMSYLFRHITTTD
ncbi:phosphoribosyl pyrophosphate synthase-associated protein 1-like [Watersipora subatra]|uniref:phosphoribosyl pyrophosphate synthase-associated protein 1-like n=1 Tax=Watersipora subatra TaxID=2589382 RepID=UPI00355B9839